MHDRTMHAMVLKGKEGGGGGGGGGGTQLSGYENDPHALKVG